MSAKEMFEELGYKQHKHYNEIQYRNGNEKYYTCICFCLNYKGFYGQYCNEPIVINMEELKAINKQCEELGWI